MGKRRNGGKGGNLIVQGGMMAVTALLVNACMVFRQIPLTGIWGDEGNGIFAAAYGVYTAVWLLSAYGLPAAISGLLKSRIKKGDYRSAGMIMQTAFLYACITGIGLGAALFFGSVYVTQRILAEPLAALPLQILSLAVIFSAWNGLLRGYFFGNGAGFPVMISMITEQIVTLVSAFFLVPLGQQRGELVGSLLQNELFSRSFAVMGFTAGILVGTAAAFLFLLPVYLLSHSYYRKKNKKQAGRKKEPILFSVSAFFAALFPLILYGVLGQGYLLIQQICFRLLMRDSLGDSVISVQWGMYSGKYKVFTMIPVLLAVVMGMTLRERVHVLHRRNDHARIRELTQNALKAAMLIVIPLAVMIGTLAVPLLEAAFPKQDEDAAALLLTGFVTAVFFSAACLFAEALRGMNKAVTLLACGLAALALHGGALYVMLELLHLDIFGVVYADILYAFCLLALLGAAARKQCGFRYGLLRSMAAPLFAGAVMGGLLFLLAGALTGVMPAWVLLLLLTVAGFLLYAVLLFLLRGVTERELRLTPGGRLLGVIGRAMGRL